MSYSHFGREGKVGSHPPVARDHREGVPLQAPSICKELARFGSQSFPLHSACSSSSFAQ